MDRAPSRVANRSASTLAMVGMTIVYEARPIRRRGTNAEMSTRREMIVNLAEEHGPCSVRHVFYQSVVAGVPGVTKNDSGYNKVQRIVLEQRRAGAIAYDAIVDSTRW